MMATTLTHNIQTTPMATYTGLLRSMSLRDKQTVVAFLLDNMEQPDDCELFGRYLAEWQRDTRFLSSVSAITAHPAFTGIVNMGGNAVPFILKEIERKPSNLVWALNIIFHKKIGDGLSVTEASSYGQPS